MKQLIFAASIILLAACTSKPTTTVEEEKPLSFVTEKYDLKSEVNKPKADEATLLSEIPVAVDDSSSIDITQKINKRIFASVKQIVAMEGDSSFFYKELFANYLANYEKLVKEYPDFPSGWVVTIKGSVEYNTPEIVNIKLDSYVMMGGAHGNSNQTSFLFDPKTGNELSVADIVSDTAAVTRLAETKFREKYGIAADQPINSTGLMFENNVFALPQNIFITNDGLQLLYNRYEVAAYAEGTKDVMLPYAEIKDHLKIKVEK